MERGVLRKQISRREALALLAGSVGACVVAETIPARADTPPGDAQNAPLASQRFTLPFKEGTIPFHGYKDWYAIVGPEDAKKPPVLILHGGPGAGHDYLEPLEALSKSGRQVIFYDQLGCGNSDHPHNPALWTIDLFVEELGAVRRALGLDRVHILGQSWGGMLAMEYALTRPKGVVSWIIHSSPASIPLWISEANRLRKQLPPEMQEKLTKHEKAGTTDSPEYEQAVMEYYRRHLCRVPWPECLQRSFEKMMRYPEVYNAMNGPSEFYVTGTLKNWDITKRLHEIKTPTLVLGGRYDEATPAITETVHHGIRGSEWVIFEKSSHMAHLEEPERYVQVAGDFLKRHDP